MFKNYHLFRRISTLLALIVGASFLMISFIFIIEPSGQIIKLHEFLDLLRQTFNYFGWFRSLFFPGLVCLVLIGAPHMIAGLLHLARIPSAIQICKISSCLFFFSSLLGVFVFQKNWLAWAFLLYSVVEFISAQLCYVFYNRYIFYFNKEDYTNINLKNKNMLVLFYALNDYTKKYAYDIANKNNCSIYEITTVEEVNSNLKWLDVVKKTVRGQSVPTNKATIDLSEYNHIYLIMESYNGKIIAPVRDFCRREVKAKSIEYDIIRFNPFKHLYNLEELDNLVGCVSSKATFTFISYGKTKTQQTITKK